MELKTKYERSSSAKISDNALSFSLMTDLSRQEGFLHAKVKSGREFSRAMLILHKVVCSNLKTQQKDHSAYQQWVIGEYIKELPDEFLRERAQAMAKLSAAKAELEEALTEALKEIKEHPLTHENYQYHSALSRFYKWLYSVDREAWLVIDPVVSVQPDAVFFEGFSLDESTYARVSLPQSDLDHITPSGRGTTNIDFSASLARELERVRSYRPLTLQVGLQGVTASTDVGGAVEKKIDLPESWVRGFMQVQSATAFPSRTLQLSASTLSEIIGVLERRRERTGPRSLRFHLSPGEYPEIEIDPWGDRIREHRFRYDGVDMETVRIWGRRRLCLLKDILTAAEHVDVRLLGTGMPSFWTVSVGPIELDLGLSGWTANDWAQQARFHELMSVSPASEQTVSRAAALLKQSTFLSPQDLGEAMRCDSPTAAAALQALCASGKAMFDHKIGAYRWRELFPPGLQIPPADPGDSRELAAARKLLDTNEVRLTSREVKENGSCSASASVKDGKYTTELALDEDGRLQQASCSCGTYHKHALRKGACRHLLATLLLVAENNGATH